MTTTSTDVQPATTSDVPSATVPLKALFDIGASGLADSIEQNSTLCQVLGLLGQVAPAPEGGGTTGIVVVLSPSVGSAGTNDEADGGTTWSVNVTGPQVTFSNDGSYVTIKGTWGGGDLNYRRKILTQVLSPDGGTQ